MGGIIFFDDGRVFPFGNITRADILISLLNETAKQLEKEERKRLKQLLASMPEEEDDGRDSG